MIKGENVIIRLIKDKSEFEKMISLYNDQNERVITDHTAIKSPYSEFELEIGYRLYKTEFHSKGYMSEALTIFSSFLFESKPIRRLKIQTTSDNKASINLALKCGYKKEGKLREGYYYRNKFCDVVILGLIRSEAKDFSKLLVKNNN